MARVGAVVGRLVAPIGFVSRMAGTASPWGWPSEWEDVVVMAAGRGPVVRGPSECGVAAVTMMVEMVFVGGCPSGCGVVIAMGAVVCEEGPSGWGLSKTTEVGAVAMEECLVELRDAVTMVSGVVPEGRRDSLGDGSWVANTSASVSAKIRRKP